ncbi:MAG: translation initiation factor IF-2 [Alphaproteobacteria bacterium]|nr:translation initiation factor IF-2 [Alphaproteobacteria bacterium]
MNKKSTKMSADKSRKPPEKSAGTDQRRTLSLKSSTDGLSARSGMVRGRGKATVAVEVKRSRSTRSVGESLANRINLGQSLSKKSTLQPRALAPTAERAGFEVDQEAQRQKAMRAREMLQEIKTQKSKDAAFAEELEGARRQREEQAQFAEQERAQVGLMALEEAQQTALQREKAATKSEPSAVVEAVAAPATPKAREKKVRVGRGDGRRRQGKLTISQALSADGEPFNRGRSVAALKRQRDKERARAQLQRDRNEMVVREVVLPETISVGDLSNRMAVRGADLIKQLFKNGMVMKLTDILDADTAELMVQEFGHNVRRVSESDVEAELLNEQEAGFDATSRSPVVTVMGHVDHGKTTLLDTLRKARVAAGEAGGITQHVAAYRVQVNKTQTVTFLDTPGHEAFSEMRSRGAKVTDIVVLVVAANDGVLPQTVEAINHARAAGVPIIVAINKCDLPVADPQRVRTELLNHGVIGEENGGDALMVEISALKGNGVDDLLDAILLQAELLELSAVAEGRSKGVVIEARQEKGRGVVATVLVQSGQLHKGDIFVAGHEWGRVKMQYDDQGNVLKVAGPSTPVEIQGLQGVVEAGDELVVVAEEATARNVAEYRQGKMNEARLVASLSHNSVDQMFQNISNKQASELNVILRTDVLGSQEAIVQALHKISTDEVTVKVMHSGIGAITESDVTLAKSSDALLIGFNVRANAPARNMARRNGIAIRYFAIIYELIDDVRGLAEGLLSPEEREEFLGYAEVREVFNLTKGGNIAGCVVTEGLVRRGAEVRLLRDDVVVHRGKLAQLRRFKDDVTEVRSGTECGMAFENHGDIKVGDRIECFIVVEERRSL